MLVKAFAISAFCIWKPIYGVAAGFFFFDRNQVVAIPLVPGKGVIFKIWFIEHVFGVAAKELAMFVINGELRVHFAN